MAVSKELNFCVLKRPILSGSPPVDYLVNDAVSAEMESRVEELRD